MSLRGCRIRGELQQQPRMEFAQGGQVADARGFLFQRCHDDFSLDGLCRSTRWDYVTKINASPIYIVGNGNCANPRQQASGSRSLSGIILVEVQSLDTCRWRDDTRTNVASCKSYVTQGASRIYADNAKEDECDVGFRSVLFIPENL